MKKIRNFVCGTAAACFALSLNAGVIAELNSPGNWRNTYAFNPASEGGLIVKGSNKYPAKNVLPFNPEKSYRFSLKIRRAPGSAPSQFYMIFEPATEEGRTIAMNHVATIRNSGGTLVEDAKAGSTSVKIKPDMARNWVVVGGWVVAFDAADDKSDLPNSKISPVMKKIDAGTDGTITVTFISPLRVDAKAGSRVRIHAGGSYIYVGQMRETPVEWTEISGTAKGISENWSNSSFPVGTSGIRPVILANWGAKDTAIEIKDVVVEEL